MTDQVTPPVVEEVTPPVVEGPDLTWMPADALVDGKPDFDKLRDNFASLRPKDADVPADANAYAIPTIEGIEPEVMKESPLFKTLTAAAHKTGMGQAAFDEVLTGYVKAEGEKATAIATAEKGKLGANAEARLSAVETWLGSKLPQEEATALQQLTSSALALQGLERLMGGSVAPRDVIPPQDAAAELAEIQKLQASPEYYDRRKRDPAVVKKVQDYYEKQAAAKAKA